MSFQSVVQSIPNISGCYRNGIKALGGYSNKINPANPRNCSGSVDLDDCLHEAQPQASRWDYIIGYGNDAYFVEVHSASGQVSKVLDKAIWLRNWLKADGQPISNIHHKDKNFHWIPTNGVNIIGKQRLLLAQNKVILVNRLKLHKIVIVPFERLKNSG